MTPHAILGLIALNLWLFLVGAAVLFALRGWRSWPELLPFVGLAYLLGIAASGILWVLLLVVGIPFSLASIFGSGALVIVVAAFVARRFDRKLPGWAVHRFRLPTLSLVGAAGAALTVIYLEALFRSGRLRALYEFDGWLFWVPKAKAIYFFGGLDHQFFRELVNPSYPTLIPALQAAAFHFMGSPDVVTLHLQLWFLLAGFVAAVVGLLSGRVPDLLLWPVLLLLLVAPQVVANALQPQGDFLMDELLGVGALLLALWLNERREWYLVASALLLGAAMLTKREGYAFGACIVVAALVATWPERRQAWPRLVAVGLAAAAVTIPWRVFLAVRHLNGGGPEAGGTGLFAHLDRAWPSLRLAMSTLFDFHIWLVVLPVGGLAALAAFWAGARRLAGYAALVYGFGIVALTWSTWAFPSFPITKNPALNPIVRLTGFLTLFVAAVAPLLLATAWEEGAQPLRRR